MDLDFSFALVSSLTPRRKVGKTSPTEEKNKPLKTKLNLPVKSLSQNAVEISHQKREGKENLIPQEQLMSKDEFLKSTENKNNSIPTKQVQGRLSDDKMPSSFSVNMENVAVRRNCTRGRKKVEISPLQPCDNVLGSSDDNVVDNSSLPNERLSICPPKIINISSDIDENCCDTQLNKSTSEEISTHGSRVNDFSVRSSLEIVESSCSEVIGDSFEDKNYHCKNLILNSVNKTNVKTRSSRKSETSLSTAYDSDSFQATRRHGVKVIPETPDTSTGSLNEKRKSSKLSFTSEEFKETNSFTNENSKKNLSAKRKSSEISVSPKDIKKRSSFESLCSNFRPKRKSLTSEKDNQIDKSNICIIDRKNEDRKQETISSTCINAVYKPSKQYSRGKAEVRQKKKIRTNNDSSVDMFKLESTIKDQSSPSRIKNEVSNTKLESPTSCSNEDQQETNKGKNNKVTDLKNCDLVKKNKMKGKDKIDQKNISKTTVGDRNLNVQRSGSKLRSSASPKMSTLVLPSEVIPKFEHINRWLKDTEEKTIGSIESDPTASNVISNKDVMPVKNKYRVSLSPRIKKKKEKAKNSLEEEQRVFEELYGTGYEKMLNDDAHQIVNRSTCQNSVEFSENVLDKLYGTVWQENAAVTRSEPRKGKNNSKKKTPVTERKKHRTSIYEVFSSSSSEDRFEEFLENVHRGKVESTKHRSKHPGTPEFIKDSDSEDDTSLVFYQNILSSAVKDEDNNHKKEEIKAGEDTHKVNRRRLSFGSSKDGCSESGRSDTKPNGKSKKSSNKTCKTKTIKSKSKKKENKYIEGNDINNVDVFSLVTPLKIKGKKAENDLNDKVSNPVVSRVPKSVGKSKTPKNPRRNKELSNSEERLKTTYLGQNDFKVPKSATKAFKTPSKTTRLDVPSSPALSFLSSLSELTAGLPCHPDALVYKKNFKSKREELTKRLFTLYNKEVFDNQLPEDMLIQWNSRMTSTSGYCYNKRIYKDNQISRSSRIVLSNKILDRADRLRDTLIHELCHAATWIIHGTSDGHGPIWRSWADKANRRFPELPVIKRCHDYAISTKFTYKCMSCGYCIGRHTKSLDTDRKRCGFCLGKFQAFVTAKMSSASATSGSDSMKTPRNPTGFALFVKENYAIVKKENNVPHAQVMKLLSQKFAEVKISKQNAEEPILVE